MLDRSQLTLISGNRLIVEQLAEHINIIGHADAEQCKTAFRNSEIQGYQYSFPEGFLPFIPEKLDREFFNISKLVTNGYVDDKVDYIPMLVMCKDIIAQGRVNFALENKVLHKREFSSIHTVSVRVDKTDISSFIDTFFDIKENNLQGNTLLLEDVTQIKLDEMVTVTG